MTPSSRTRPAASRRRQLRQPERLEDRLLMDGAGFVNTDPPEDPASIVGVAEIVANDDYRRISLGVQSVRISPLANDQLPDGASKLTIKLVSDTAQGATVSVSEDGQHLIYTAAGNEGFQGWDSFYYIVQTEDGRLGKANVQLGRKSTSSTPGTPSSTRGIHPSYTILEDSDERFLRVIRQHFKRPEYEGATITSVTRPEGGGSIRISDDGQGLWYQPEYAFTGRDDVRITVRTGDGTENDFRVRIYVQKPYGIETKNDGAFIERGTGPFTFTPLGNDIHRRAFEVPPYIESATVPDYSGTISLTASGKGMVFDPAPDFEGSVAIPYTVRYGEADHQTVTGRIYAWVADGYQAVENYFLVEPNSGPMELDVLANDPNYRSYYGLTLRIVEVSAASAGGEVTHNGSTIRYQPSPGYEGDETFTYTVESSSGVRQTAHVTIEVAPRPASPFGIAQFATERELEQYLIDRAVQHYGGAFGHFVEKYGPLPAGVVLRQYFDADAGLTRNSDHSETNTQVDGVDEADIVETDGRYVYTLSDGKLAIVDLADPSKPVLTSLTEFETKIDEMYLQDDRLTLIHRGAPASTRYYGVYSGYHQELEEDQAVVFVLDISDRSAPTIAERTEINGYIADSRAIGSKVHFVIQRAFDYPELGGRWIIDPIPPDVEDAYIDPISGVGYVTHLGTRGIWANESLEQYLARVRDELIETGLPSFETYNAAGELSASGLLTTPTNLHQAIGGDNLVVSLLTIDTADAAWGPAAEATSFIADNQTTVYVSTESVFLFAYDVATDTTAISKLDLSDDGTLPLVATGQIRGKLLNQFSADEYEGRLRVATTQQERRYFNEGRNWRQRRLFNNLLVIEQHGAELNVVGKVENLAPTETIKSVRFMGERAYVVTFRVVDPLFAIDLSNPTVPVVRGALKIPGFSDYLHPVGNDYLLGIGRDADEITGRLGPFQITLFDVSDLDDPSVADQVTFEGASWVDSEAWIDHHAVAFFEEAGVLAVPLAWSETVKKERDDGTTYESNERHEATWTFDVKTSGNAKIKATGKVEHPKPPEPGITTIQPYAFTSAVIIDVWIPPRLATPSPMQRALRIDDALVTVSNDWVQVHKLKQPKQQIGEVHLGRPVADDRFTIDEDSGPNTFDVLKNDPPTATGAAAPIVSVADVIGGTAVISEDGQSVEFTPDQDYFGHASFSYTVDAPVHGEVSARVSVFVRGTPDDPMAVDDTHTLDNSSDTVELDVLANDLNPDFTNGNYFVLTTSILVDAWRIQPASENQGLVITEVGPTSSGALVEITDQGTVNYTPAEDFVGIDTFTYTIHDHLNRTDTATVTIYAGVEPPVEVSPPVEDPPVAQPLGKAEEEAPHRSASADAPSMAEPIDDALESLFGHTGRHPRLRAQPLAARPAPTDHLTLWALAVDKVHDDPAERETTSGRRHATRHDDATPEKDLTAGGLRESLALKPHLLDSFPPMV